MAQALLTLRDILVRYGPSTILAFSSLSVHRGEVLAVIGPNGAGKSTLLRVMGLLQPPTEGKIYFHGEEVKPTNGLALRRRMASVFQEPLLLNTSVYENAALGLKLRGLGRHAVEKRVLPWLERLGISHLAKRQARGLSGGEAQRTSLARALALDPEMLLLDEPFSPLDPPTRERFLVDLERILGETGITAVFVTHDRDEAFTLGDRAAVLIGGRVHQVGVTAEVFAQPVDEEVAHFVGVDTKIPAVVDSAAGGLARVRFDGGGAEVVGEFQPAERVILCLRPEDITLSPASGEDVKSSACNRLMANVAKITPWGSHYRVAVDCDGTRLIASMTRPSFVDLKLSVGDEIVASFKATAVHVIRRK
jgi:tungstate transport system ATP-binding protein